MRREIDIGDILTSCSSQTAALFALQPECSADAQHRLRVSSCCSVVSTCDTLAPSPAVPPVCCVAQLVVVSWCRAPLPVTRPSPLSEPPGLLCFRLREDDDASSTGDDRHGLLGSITTKIKGLKFGSPKISFFCWISCQQKEIQSSSICSGDIFMYGSRREHVWVMLSCMDHVWRVPYNQLMPKILHPAWDPGVPCNYGWS